MIKVTYGDKSIILKDWDLKVINLRNGGKKNDGYDRFFDVADFSPPDQDREIEDFIRVIKGE